MKHISILVPTGAHLGCIDGCLQVLTEVNSFLEAKGKPPAFTIQLTGISTKTPLKNGLFTVYPDILISDLKKTDLIIIPAPFHLDFSQTIESNKEYIPWIVDQYKQGAAVASLCVGAFLLAATGLLNGKKMLDALDVCQ